MPLVQACDIINLLKKKLGLNNEFDKMREEHYLLDDMFVKLFVETNPIPVKTLSYMMGKIKNVFRLPICEASQNTISILEELKKKYKI